MEDTIRVCAIAENPLPRIIPKKENFPFKYETITSSNPNTPYNYNIQTKINEDAKNYSMASNAAGLRDVILTYGVPEKEFARQFKQDLINAGVSMRMQIDHSLIYNNSKFKTTFNITDDDILEIPNFSIFSTIHNKFFVYGYDFTYGPEIAQVVKDFKKLSVSIPDDLKNKSIFSPEFKSYLSKYPELKNVLKILKNISKPYLKITPESINKAIEHFNLGWLNGDNQESSDYAFISGTGDCDDFHRTVAFLSEQIFEDTYGYVIGVFPNTIFPDKAYQRGDLITPSGGHAMTLLHHPLWIKKNDSVQKIMVWSHFDWAAISIGMTPADAVLGWAKGMGFTTKVKKYITENLSIMHTGEFLKPAELKSYTQLAGFNNIEKQSPNNVAEYSKAEHMSGYVALLEWLPEGLCPMNAHELKNIRINATKSYLLGSTKLTQTITMNDSKLEGTYESDHYFGPQQLLSFEICGDIPYMSPKNNVPLKPPLNPQNTNLHGYFIEEQTLNYLINFFKQDFFQLLRGDLYNAIKSGSFKIHLMHGFIGPDIFVIDNVNIDYKIHQILTHANEIQHALIYLKDKGPIAEKNNKKYYFIFPEIAKYFINSEMLSHGTIDTDTIQKFKIPFTFTDTSQIMSLPDDMKDIVNNANYIVTLYAEPNSDGKYALVITPNVYKPIAWEEAINQNTKFLVENDETKSILNSIITNIDWSAYFGMYKTPKFILPDNLGILGAFKLPEDKNVTNFLSNTQKYMKNHYVKEASKIKMPTPIPSEIQQ